MSDERDDDAVRRDLERPDPRLRPPDPAGTQPKWDPDELLPQEKPPAAHDRLWSPPGEDDADREVAAAAPEVAAVPDDADASEEPLRSRYSGRFHFLLGALLACGAAAVALLFAALLGGSSTTRTITLKTLPAWSRWHPTAGTGSAAAQQIATHVAHQYHGSDGRQLVLATGSALNYGGFPASLVIRHSVANGGTDDVLDGAAVQYALCGIGGADAPVTPSKTKACMIPAAGKATKSRELLLRREAVELALYSFKYLPVTQTVVLMPPTPGRTAAGKTTNKTPTQTALLFRSTTPGVATAITRPLKATLSDTAPTLRSVASAPDAKAVGSLTADGVVFDFHFSLSPQDGQAFLVLDEAAG